MGPRNRDSLTLCLDAGELDPNLHAIDALARLALAARRCGYSIVLRNASPELTDLIELAGLSETLRSQPLRPRSTEPRC